MSGVNLTHDLHVPASDDADRPGRKPRSGCLRTGGIAMVVLFCFGDVLLQGTSHAPVWPQLLLLAIGLAALLWPVARRPAWLTPAVRTGLPPLAALAYVVILVGAGRPGAFGPGQAAAFRVVQESLTNVRRHAADATEVTVSLRYGRGDLEVSVRDDGRGGARLPEAARGGGFGLVGLTERVTQLGGRIQARAREGGPGWEVVAVLPATPAAAR